MSPTRWGTTEMKSSAFQRFFHLRSSAQICGEWFRLSDRALPSISRSGNKNRRKINENFRAPVAR
jgi:hypothetical protein